MTDTEALKALVAEASKQQAIIDAHHADAIDREVARGRLHEAESKIGYSWRAIERLLAGQQEPVAYMHVSGGGVVTARNREDMSRDGRRQYSIPLFAAPPVQEAGREPIELTDEQDAEIDKRIMESRLNTHYMTYAVIAERMRGQGNDPENCTLGDVLCAARKEARAYLREEFESSVAEPASLGAETAAQAFHEAYERLAPQFGYETRKESAKPWAQVPENNRKLMVAVCAEVLGKHQPIKAEVAPLDMQVP